MATARESVATRREVAARLGMTPYLVRRLVEAGELRTVALGRRSFILLADVESFERRLLVGTSSEATGPAA